MLNTNQKTISNMMQVFQTNNYLFDEEQVAWTTPIAMSFCTNVVLSFLTCFVPSYFFVYVCVYYMVILIIAAYAGILFLWVLVKVIRISNQVRTKQETYDMLRQVYVWLILFTLLFLKLFAKLIFSR
jgi:hypothetical protein